MKEKHPETHEHKIDSEFDATAKKSKFSRLKENKVIIPILIGVLFLIAIGSLVYVMIANGRVYVEKSEINAPIISINPASPGILYKVYVKEGDVIGKSKPLALVGNTELLSQSHGIVVAIKDVPGQYVKPEDAIVKIVNPDDLRVIGHVDEDKGLADIKPGEKVVFTVDAFGSKKYEGVVDTIIPTSRQSDIVFSISDQREVRVFDVKVRFDVEKYPELRNGMSAKMWIYKN